MKFSEQKSELSEGSTPITLPAYQKEYILKSTTPDINDIRQKCVYYLADDLTRTNNTIDFNAFLGDYFYSSSNDYAFACLELSFYVRNIFGHRIKHWTDNALKCFDNFLIKYINQVKNEKIPKHHGKPYETDVYEHLISKSGPEYEVGIAFQSIYQSRNSFTHVQEEIQDGIRRPVKWSGKRFSKEKDLIIGQFEKGLKLLFSLIS